VISAEMRLHEGVMPMTPRAWPTICCNFRNFQINAESMRSGLCSTQLSSAFLDQYIMDHRVFRFLSSWSRPQSQQIGGSARQPNPKDKRASRMSAE
jgi:hypothetical protein